MMSLNFGVPCDNMGVTVVDGGQHWDSPVILPLLYQDVTTADVACCSSFGTHFKYFCAHLQLSWQPTLDGLCEIFDSYKVTVSLPRTSCQFRIRIVVVWKEHTAGVWQILCQAKNNCLGESVALIGICLASVWLKLEITAVTTLHTANKAWWQTIVTNSTGVFCI